MSRKIENAKKLYIRGIEKGEIEEVQKYYMGNTYTQHSTGVPDEKEGFRVFFNDFFKRYPERKIEIVRAIEDGNYVFLHVHQYLNGGASQWITADMFKTDAEDRMIEHWDVIDYYPLKDIKIDPIYGDFLIKDLEKTIENKKIVRRFLVDILQNKDYDRFYDYVSIDLVQHNQEINQGGKEYKNYLMNHNVEYDFIFKVMGQGNYVVSYSKVMIDNEFYAQFDIFRLEDGKIVEHWDNKEIVPNKIDLVNLGKF